VNRSGTEPGPVQPFRHSASTAAHAADEVTFDIDANGILHRVCEGQGDWQGKQDQDPGKLRFAEAEIQKMVQEAEMLPKTTARRSNWLPHATSWTH